MADTKKKKTKKNWINILRKSLTGTWQNFAVSKLERMEKNEEFCGAEKHFLSKLFYTTQPSCVTNKTFRRMITFVTFMIIFIFLYFYFLFYFCCCFDKSEICFSFLCMLPCNCAVKPQKKKKYRQFIAVSCQKFMHFFFLFCFVL